jgi:hypothetical protein
MEWIASILADIRRNFGIADALDILVVSVLLYSLLVWFKETASRRVLIGVLVLTVVYLIARVFDMYLTSLMFHAGLAVLVIVLVVVFQEDLRRMLEGVTHWGLLRRFRTASAHGLNVDAVVQAVFAMAAERTGALMVFKGLESIDRHVDGGITLRGEISKPLLLTMERSSSRTDASNRSRRIYRFRRTRSRLRAAAHGTAPRSACPNAATRWWWWSPRSAAPCPLPRRASSSRFGRRLRSRAGSNDSWPRNTHRRSPPLRGGGSLRAAGT